MRALGRPTPFNRDARDGQDSSFAAAARLRHPGHPVHPCLWPFAAAALVLFLGAGASAREGLVLEPGAPERGGEDAGLIVGEEESLWRLFRKGGYVMPAILVASIVALAFAIERGVALRSSVQTPRGLAEDVASRLSRGGTGAAAALVEGRDGALPKVLAATLGRLSDGRAGMEEAASAESYRALYELRRNVRPIGIVASVAPLMGLLGTVLGMIKAFDVASGGGLGRGQELARGIAEALLTTGAGLIVAIPALVAYHYFRARAEDFTRRSEADAASFIDRALASRARKGRDERGAGATRPGTPARSAESPSPTGPAHAGATKGTKGE